MTRGELPTSGLKLPMRVWDAPIRLIHWAVVVLVLVSFISAQLGWMQIHLVSGYVMLTALLFRLVWGFAGSETARFRAFLVSPVKGLRHLSAFSRREPDTEIGHNAAGGWIVLVILLLLGLQVATGLGANNDHGTEGPLAKYLGKQLSNRVSEAHSVNFWLIVAAIVVHMLAVAAYAWLKGQNLLRPMITGKKRLPGAMRAPRMATPLRAITVFLGAAAITALIATRL